MFQKLRLRLVLANVVVTAFIVMAMAVIAWLMISDNVSKQSRQILQLIGANTAMHAMKGTDSTVFSDKMLGGVYPYFVVQADEGVRIVQSNMIMDPDDPELQAVVRNLIAADAQRMDTSADEAKRQKLAGKLDVVNIGGQSFRTTSVSDQDGTPYFIFLDMVTERALLGRIAFSLMLCALAGLALAFTGSLFLANRSIKPVSLSWQRQREFTGDASHEMRSPLAAILGSVESVLAHPQSTVEEKRSFLTGIAEETRHMSRLVDDLLLLARADSDALIFQNDAVNIASLARDSMDKMKPFAQRKRIGCSLEIFATPLVRGDAERLRQVLIILLDNAVKYTSQGGSIQVAVRYEAGRAFIDVADTGIGIAREHIPAIFGRFYRVDKARSREAGGHGLGLSIAKWIVERHKGTITVMSEPGKGSTFSVMLPEALR